MSFFEKFAIIECKKAAFSPLKLSHDVLGRNRDLLIVEGISPTREPKGISKEFPFAEIFFQQEHATREIFAFPRQLFDDMAPVKIGIIGGTGFDDPKLFESKVEKSVTTVFGKPSDVLVCGKISGVECVLLPRHAKGQLVNPSNINYRANIMALKNEGCTHVIVTTAVGSLKEEVNVGDMVFVDDLFDRTYRRETSFYDGKDGSPIGICHIPMHEPFCSETRKILQESSKELGIKYHEKGTCVVIEGPRFSTKPESKFYQSLGASIVGMTLCPEAILAKEAGLCYAPIAMVTDYDTWKEDAEVDVPTVMKTVKDNAVKAKRIIINSIPKIASQDWTKIIEKNQEVVRDSIMLPS
eukprot:gene8189-9067_t